MFAKHGSKSLNLLDIRRKVLQKMLRSLPSEQTFLPGVERFPPRSRAASSPEPDNVLPGAGENLPVNGDINICKKLNTIAYRTFPCGKHFININKKSMNNKIRNNIVVLLAIFLFASCWNEGNNRKIKIAYANWAEGIAMTYLAKEILQEQGYDVELLNADVAPIFTSLSRKKADVFMDVWLPVTMIDYIEQYGDKLEIIGGVYDEARIGLVVPEYVTINSIDELNAQKQRFGSKIIGIDAGAGIMRATEDVIEDYNLDYVLMTSSGPAMTASLKKAIDRNEWIVVTGWTPHWMFDRFKLKILQDPKNIYGNAEKIYTVTWKGFPEKDPFATQLFKNIRLTDEQISSLMTAMEETEKTEKEAARKWIDEHRELVDSWIPKEQ